MDEVFGAENFCRLIVVREDEPAARRRTFCRPSHDYLLWYARDSDRASKYRQLYLSEESVGDGELSTLVVELPDGTSRG